MKKVRKEKKVVKKKEQQRFGDLKLMAKIQPQGGINFNKDEGIFRKSVRFTVFYDIFLQDKEKRRLHNFKMYYQKYINNIT